MLVSEIIERLSDPARPVASRADYGGGIGR